MHRCIINVSEGQTCARNSVIGDCGAKALVSSLVTRHSMGSASEASASASACCDSEIVSDQAWLGLDQSKPTDSRYRIMHQQGGVVGQDPDGKIGASQAGVGQNVRRLVLHPHNFT